MFRSEKVDAWQWGMALLLLGMSSLLGASVSPPLPDCVELPLLHVSAPLLAKNELGMSKNIFQRFCTHNQSAQDRAFAQSRELSDWFYCHFPRRAPPYKIVRRRIQMAYNSLYPLEFEMPPERVYDRSIEDQQLVPSVKNGKYFYTLYDIFLNRLQSYKYLNYLKYVSQKESYKTKEWLLKDHVQAWHKVIMSDARFNGDLRDFVAGQQASPLPANVLALVAAFVVGEQASGMTGAEINNTRASLDDGTLFALLERYSPNVVAEAVATCRDVCLSRGDYDCREDWVNLPDEAQVRAIQNKECCCCTPL